MNKNHLIDNTMIPSSKKMINRLPEQGSMTLLEEIQKKCNQSLTNSTCVNSNNISYETPSMNNLSSFYMKDDVSKFMKKIDKLNLNFMLLSDKYLKHQKEVEKVKDNLFINLFKQISVYVEEIERLNIKIKDKEGSSKTLKENSIKELNKEINQHKVTIKTLESKLNEKSQNEDRLKKELNSYKRQVSFYKDKLKLEIQNQKEKAQKICQALNNSSYISVNTINYSNTIVNTAGNSNKKYLPNSVFSSPYSKAKNKTIRRVQLTKKSHSPSIESRKGKKTHFNISDDFNLNTSRSETVEKTLKIHMKKEKGNSSSTSCIFSNLDTKSSSSSGIIKKEGYKLFEKKGSLTFLERQNIIDYVGEEVNNNFDKEIEMLIEQENQINSILNMISD